MCVQRKKTEHDKQNENEAISHAIMQLLSDGKMHEMHELKHLSNASAETVSSVVRQLAHEELIMLKGTSIMLPEE